MALMFAVAQDRDVVGADPSSAIAISGQRAIGITVWLLWQDDNLSHDPTRGRIF